jgi:hypothetical protein
MATIEQRMAALAIANVVRTTNSQTWHDIRARGREAGRERAAELLEDLEPGEPLAAMPVRRLLLAIPRFGESRMRRCLANAGVHSGDRRVGQLSERQRQMLADMLRGVA